MLSGIGYRAIASTFFGPYNPPPSVVVVWCGYSLPRFFRVFHKLCSGFSRPCCRPRIGAADGKGVSAPRLRGSTLLHYGLRRCPRTPPVTFRGRPRTAARVSGCGGRLPLLLQLRCHSTRRYGWLGRWSSPCPILLLSFSPR